MSASSTTLVQAREGQCKGVSTPRRLFNHGRNLAEKGRQCKRVSTPRRLFNHGRNLAERGSKHVSTPRRLFNHGRNLAEKNVISTTGREGRPWLTAN